MLDSGAETPSSLFVVRRHGRVFRRRHTRLCRGPPLSAPACMHPFATYVLRSYYKATGWNEDNLYANFTRSSNGMSHSSSKARRNLVLISSNSRPRLYRPPWPASLHIEIPKHALSDDIFNECSSISERIRWLHLHLLRPRSQEFKKYPFQGYGRSLQGLRASEKAQSQRRGIPRRRTCRSPWYVSTRMSESQRSERRTHRHCQTTSSTVVSTFLPLALMLCTLQGCHLLFKASSQPSPIPVPTLGSHNRPARHHHRATSCSVSSTTQVAGVRNIRTAPKTAC